jgi:hypothetical protein
VVVIYVNKSVYVFGSLDDLRKFDLEAGRSRYFAKPSSGTWRPPTSMSA